MQAMIPRPQRTAAPPAEPAQANGPPSAAEAVVANSAGVDLQFTRDGGLVLDGLPLAQKAGALELQKRLGAPSREKTYPSGELALYYDDRGLVLWTGGGELKGIGLNFNWDGDERFPETSFTGSLVVDGLNVDRNTTLAQFQALKSGGVSCIMDDRMCGGGTPDTRFVVGFEKKAITQVTFLLEKKSP